MQEANYECETKTDANASGDVLCAGESESIIRNPVSRSHFAGKFMTSKAEHSPSYEELLKHNLLTTTHRVDAEEELAIEPSNSSRAWNMASSILCCPMVCLGIIKNFEVPNGDLKKAYDGRGNYSFYGPGVHQIIDPFYVIAQETVSYVTGNVVHGDRSIVTIPQGFIGYCTQLGQPILLPPGIHQWRDAMLKFERIIDLNDSVIPLGPWTLLTIDQGYMAVTQDNGVQIILNGGNVHILTHKNWKFEKFVSTKIQTNVLQRIEAASADNVVMLVDATVLWRIDDVETAVRMSAETMDADGSKAGKNNIVKLRNDVLQQAQASLAFFIGTINFSDTMAAAAIQQRRQDEPFAAHAVVEKPSTAATTDTPMAEVPVFNLYDNPKLKDAVRHANENTHSYGVLIISINIISAIPKDKQLQASLAAGAVAAAEAQMMETTAQGKGRAIEIEAAANAKQTMILAKAGADADVLRAAGAKQAADLLATNPVSIDLAKIERTGAALAGKGNHATFFFGADAGQLSSLLSNNDVVKSSAHNMK